MVPSPQDGPLHIGVPRQLDLSLIVRGVTAVIVVWWHTWGYRLGMPELSMLYIPGRIAVFMFFIISGYVITAGFAEGRYALTKPGLAAFWRNRILRIYPLFLAVSLAALAVRGIQGRALDIDAGFVMREILMLQWWHNYELNGVFWTLGVELQFYIFVPALILLHWRRGPNLKAALLIYAALLAYPSIAHYVFGALWDDRTLPGNLLQFQAGALVNHIRPRIAARAAHMPRAVPVALVAAALGAIMLASDFYNRHPLSFWSGPGLLLVDAAGVALLVAHTIYEEWRIPLNAVTRILSVAGVLSYGIYAWHGLVLTYFTAFLDHFVPTLVASIGLAAITYLLVERPCLRLKSPGVAPRTLGAVRTAQQTSA